MGKRIDLNAAAAVTGSRYPSPFGVPCAARVRQRLGDAAQLTDFGVNLTHLPPGAWSSQRHWHSAEDEFVFVLEGEVALVTDAGEEILKAGDCAGFKAGDPDGHHLQNRSQRMAVVLEVGSRKAADDEVDYPDIDLRFLKGRQGFAHKNRTPYPKHPAKT
ncbi:MAG TPA: cupin domain-containing protein [Steroidobacteraceae bacterium]|nr:cupin domain-containing protein [Steroidobacteraceae bacterium]